VRARSGTLATGERREDGGLGAILLGDGERIEADLFLDCAGPSAPLLSAVAERFEDWSEYLPCDRLLLGEEAGAPSPVDRAAATATGCRFTSPGLARTFTGAAFSSDYGQPEAAGAELVTLRPGRRPEPWVRNVVAFGDAAVALDPLEWTNLHLAQSAIMRALTLLPGRDCHPLVLREYNSLTGYETARARDFVALHYLESQRTEGAFWQSMRDRRRPDSLAHTLEQFRERGRLPHHEEESFPEESWLAALIGLGIRPRRVAATATTVDLGESLATMARVIELTAPLPAQLPPYPAYLNEIKALRR
jgi:tryptophan halogenase